MKKVKANKMENKIFIAIILLIIILIISNPETAVNSAREGLNLWFNILVPALLPFLILSELLIRLKFIHVFGKLLEPLMKPVFNVSGCGAFPFIMSIMSGYPVGVKLTSRLRQENSISKVEGDRLISFASTSGPLFIIGAVLVGMLNSPKLSFLVIAPHYLGSITIGLLFRRYKFKKGEDSVSKTNEINNKTDLENPKTPIGILISSSVRDSIDSILLIGGFVIIYSVIIDLLFTSNGFNNLLLLVSGRTRINPDIIKSLVAGIIELTTGCKKIAESNISMILKILICNFLIGWGGLSIHSQALSFISQTDLNTGIYLLAKFFHGLFAAFYTYLLYVFFYKRAIIPSMVITSFPIENNFNSWINIFTTSLKISIGASIYFILLALFINELSKKRVKRLI